MEILSAENGAVLAITVGLTQLLKGLLPARFVPLMGLVIGILTSLLVNGLSLASGIQGLIVGLTANGVYDQTKLIK